MRHHAHCWLRSFTPPAKERACEGRMDRAHLVTCQLLRREGHEVLIPDERTWVPACRLHHTWFDNYVLSVPPTALPQAFLELMEEIRLDWWVDRRYGAENASSAL